ncbi:SWIM zinc finger family protein [Streptomyces sp. AC550_RSS872]|uniref:SWIM zinc finger family protein n=1 Tax=Streptomyces sp. AC550_RSS872 TaxID=2823689 RepID=UPI001C27413F|nr:SWIM zinc finger family protein [Streptomyces sp. AC550_RSS872]
MARRALRAARERREGAPGRDAEQAVSADEESAMDEHTRRGGRPGDAARAALRRAVTARRSGGEGAEGAEDGTGDSARVPAASCGAPAVDASGADRDVSDASVADQEALAAPSDDQEGAAGDQGGARPAAPPSTRPADAAREALRATLGERRRAESEQAGRGGRGTRPSRRPARTGSAGDGSDSLRARDVRTLLAGAFQMPTSDSPHGDHPATPSTPGTPAGPAAPAAPATPQVPRSMAAPGRDSELRRTFPAFPPRPSDDDRFAETWWGNAWVAALEQGALDAKRLARGRGYAQEGHVDAITVTPGLALAYVRGSRPRPYRVQVRLRTLDDADWTRFLDAVAERPGHIAALLDKEMPQTLAECGVPLLPGPGDLEPHCSCPDRGHPCKHAAALCYQTARLLDADPFVLLLLRGRGERGLLDALSRLSAARAARAAQEQGPAPLAGVRATEALAPGRRLPALPAPLPMPPHPEQPPVYPAAPGGPDPFALDQLATDAAARAHALLSAGRDPVAELTLWQDAVRLAAARPGSGLTAGTRSLYSSLSAAADRTPAELARAVAAWRQGGLEGLAVLEEPWDPPAGRFDRARPLLLAADLPAFRPWRNRLTHPRGHVQLRLGRDGLWYPYESEPGHDDWWPRGTPDLDPVGALTGLGAATPED